MDIWNSIVNAGTSQWAISLRSLVGVLSGPGGFGELRLRSDLITTLMVMVWSGLDRGFLL